MLRLAGFQFQNEFDSGTGWHSFYAPIAKINVREKTDKTMAEIRNSKLIEYDGAPHGLFATHKERLTADLLQFLGQK